MKNCIQKEKEQLNKLTDKEKKDSKRKQLVALAKTFEKILEKKHEFNNADIFYREAKAIRASNFFIKFINKLNRFVWGYGTLPLNAFIVSTLFAFSIGVIALYLPIKIDNAAVTLVDIITNAFLGRPTSLEGISINYKILFSFMIFIQVVLLKLFFIALGRSLLR